MQNHTMRQKIKQIIYEITNIKPEEIRDDAHFIEELKLDSLTMLEIGVHLDQEFDLDLPEEEMQKFTSVEASAAIILAHLGQPA